MIDRVMTITLIVLVLAWVLTKSGETVQVANGLADAYSKGIKALRP